MFKALFGRNTASDDAHAIYGRVVARSRDPEFYTSYGVPDTFDGRFEMLVMHLFVLHVRLKDEAEPVRKVSQLVFDNFLNDMDSALRELGVGDQTVPKRLNKMTRVFYGRTGAYEEALQLESPHQCQNALTGVIDRNLFTDTGNAECSQLIAAYMLDLVDHVRETDVNAIVKKHQIFIGSPDQRNAG